MLQNVIQKETTDLNKALCIYSNIAGCDEEIIDLLIKDPLFAFILKTQSRKIIPILDVSNMVYNLIDGSSIEQVKTIMDGQFVCFLKEVLASSQI